MCPVRADAPGHGGGSSFPAGHPGQKGPLAAMQIQLTVLGPRSGLPGHQAYACDVLVTAPVGTALASVAAVAAAGADVGTGTVAVYPGAERLDARRCVLGEPPLVDGAVLALQAPAAPEEQPHPYPALCSTAPARLHVVAGPDAGGVHLLHGGQARIGRSSNADVPLDDPDVSRAHCAVSVSDDGRVTVADLGSTNGTHLDGLRIGESALRVHAPPPGLAPHGEPAAAGQYAAQAPTGAAGNPPAGAPAPRAAGHPTGRRGQPAGGAGRPDVHRADDRRAHGRPRSGHARRSRHPDDDTGRRGGRRARSVRVRWAGAAAWRAGRRRGARPGPEPGVRHGSGGCAVRGR